MTRSYPLPRAKLRLVQQMVEADLMANVTVPEMAQAAGLTTGWFINRFTDATGKTPHQWVISRRAEEAKRLLQEPAAHPLPDIAAWCGFSDLEHFVTTFRKREGVSPAAWRERGQAAALARVVADESAWVGK